MHNLFFQIRYALRQFRLAPVFTISAVLTLALGIGGTTAIFTLIDAVMLRSLPVSDPAALYRVGDGSNCCVQSGSQDRWGMYSYPLYQRLKSQTPEFEETTAFKAGLVHMSVRREGAESVAQPLAAEYVTGSYFSTLGIALSRDVCSLPRTTPKAPRPSPFSAIAPGRRSMLPIPRSSALNLISKAIRSP